MSDVTAAGQSRGLRQRALHLLLVAPNLDEPPGFRAQVQSAVPNLRIVDEGAVPDSLIDFVIVDDLCAVKVSGLKNASAILSLSLGVDRLLAGLISPDVQIVRLLTPEHQWLMREYVADHILRGQRRIEVAARQQSQRQWKWLPATVPLAGRKALVLGMGFLGEPTATLLSDLGLSVTGWSRTARPVPGIRCIAGRDALLDAALDADYLICMLPLTAATRCVLDAALLRSLPRRAVVINASRAGCLDQAELVRMLQQGALRGAVLDVLDEEPLSSESHLWSVPNLAITPHSAAVPAAEAYVPAIVDALRRITDGRAPEHLVDRARGY